MKYNELASSLSTLTSSGLLTPDHETEEYVRKVFDLPKKEEEEELEMDQEEEDTANAPESGEKVISKNENEPKKKKSVAEMSDEARSMGFSDSDELSDFLEARKFFDPSILIRVQNNAKH